jgi:hypothetical protein
MITLTREEAQQVLDALQCATPPTFSAKIVEDWQSAVEFLRARLSAPEPVPTNNGRYLTGYGAQPEPEPVTDKYLMEVECTKCGAKQDGVLTVTVPPQRNEQEPAGWIYEDDEGRMMFSQMPQNPPLWEPVYRAKPREKNT